MRISPLETEHAQPGCEPLVAEKFFIQNTTVMKTSDGSRVIWQDSPIDGNPEGFRTQDRAQGCMSSLMKSRHFGGGVQLRVIRRTCTIETEVIAG